MNVIHIIPSVFDYFDDIRDSAMALAERERDFGINAEAYTLQYGTVSRNEQAVTAYKTPTMKFSGLFSGSYVISELDAADVVHLHAPFMGLAGDLIKWKKERNIPLIVTFYRNVNIRDLFSLLLSLYNRYYLPKIINLADLVIASTSDTCKKLSVCSKISGTGKLRILSELVSGSENENIHLTLDKNTIKLSTADVEARAYISVYNHLLNI
ncbi:MAG: hypothetical protein NTW66_03170 [Candidatus Magasanikbacteria bacterium]|nr:hypothetical protein [Candidatus Magasanikbacteria bacterium]